MDFKSKYPRDFVEQIEKFRLIDDDFMKACFKDNIPAVQLVLRIILGDDKLVVTEVRTQDELKNIYGRSVCLDIHAIDGHGRHHDIEIQRSDKGACAQRARFNSAIMDANILRAGEDFEDLPDSCVIMITENDVLKGNLPIYHIDRLVRETKTPFNDGASLIYVNSRYQDDSPLGKLMKDFYCADARDIYYPELAGRVEFLKNSEEGVSQMCEAMEKIKNSGKLEGKIENMVNLIKRGLISVDTAVMADPDVTRDRLIRYAEAHGVVLQA